MKKLCLISVIFILFGCNKTNTYSSSFNSIFSSSSSNESSFVTSFSSDEQTTADNSYLDSSSIITSSSEELTESSSKISTPLDPVSKYYKDIDFTKTGSELMKDLDSLLDSTSNNTFTYKNLFDVFIYTDVDPNDSSKMLSFYSGTPAIKSQMNREHTWPNSRGGNFVENDPHVIRPTITSENSSRGNDFYNEGTKWDPAEFGNYKYRGIAARIIFYAAVKGQDKGLYLIDKEDDPRTSSGWNKSMGKLSTLLKWNLEYDIDETEITRNEVLFNKFNHCRNPFIDNRNLACQIFGDTNSETLKVCSSNK